MSAVFIVLRGEDWEGHGVEGVFSAQEEAEAFAWSLRPRLEREWKEEEDLDPYGEHVVTVLRAGTETIFIERWDDERHL